MTTDWQTYSHPDLALRWRYPVITPGGHAVERIEEQRGDVWRVHLVSRDSPELYFEVRRYLALAAEAAYARHQAELAERFKDETFGITPLAPAAVAGRAAQGYRFHWGQHARAALLVPEGAALYRLIYDPRSDLNTQVLATAEFATR